uniref:Uncharacterized protein n=1 Tax=Arundo donax TaxID=35708 RepID=A0A0A9CIT5_ARUDO
MMDGTLYACLAIISNNSTCTFSFRGYLCGLVSSARSATWKFMSTSCARMILLFLQDYLPLPVLFCGCSMSLKKESCSAAARRSGLLVTWNLFKVVSYSGLE